MLAGAILAVVLLIVGTLVFAKSEKQPEATITTKTIETEQSQLPDTDENTPEDEKDEVPQPSAPPVVEPEPAVWPIQLTLEQAASLTVVVNKKHKLPSNYVPSLTAVAGGNMRPEAAAALQQLLNDASAAGVPMVIISSYRSYQTQVSTYQKWVNLQGQAEADRGSARPGHSEHQTGLAVDLGNPDGSCDLLICFGGTSAGQWLSANSAEYGFIIRYPDGKETATGYQYEPWHLRYLGVGTAKAVKTSGLTLDQYYGVEAGDYQ